MQFFEIRTILIGKCNNVGEAGNSNCDTNLSHKKSQSVCLQLPEYNSLAVPSWKIFNFTFVVFSLSKILTVPTTSYSYIYIFSYYSYYNVVRMITTVSILGVTGKLFYFGFQENYTMQLLQSR